MPSYNKAKMLRLLEENNEHYEVLRRSSERIEETRTDVRRIENAILTGVPGNMTDSRVRDLLDLPIKEARAKIAIHQSQKSLPESEVIEAYKNGEWFFPTKLVNPETFDDLQNAREKLQRLQDKHNALAANSERFRIVDSLCNAVKSWGFRDPKVEV